MTMFTFGISLLAGGLYIYRTFAEVPIVIKDNNNIIVDKEIYSPWDRITYTISYCKKYDISATVSRALVNSIRINYTEYSTNVLPGCGTIKINDMVIPEFIDAGKYHIETTSTYKVNPIKTHIIVRRSVDFLIK